MEAFTAVVTTGIYCRAVGCPGAPLRRNMRPYAYAAAAEADGFRPCLRCRPDREPAAGWIEAPELVCRALRAISSGALDGMVALAEQCLADYDEHGWKDKAWVNPGDVSWLGRHAGARAAE